MRESSAVGVFRGIPPYPMHAAGRQQANIYAECFIITVCFIESVINIAYMRKNKAVSVNIMFFYMPMNDETFLVLPENVSMSGRSGTT